MEPFVAECNRNGSAEPQALQEDNNKEKNPAFSPGF